MELSEFVDDGGGWVGNVGLGECGTSATIEAFSVEGFGTVDLRLSEVGVVV